MFHRESSKDLENATARRTTALGDVAYSKGRLSEFANCFDQVWEASGRASCRPLDITCTNPPKPTAQKPTAQKPLSARRPARADIDGTASRSAAGKSCTSIATPMHESPQAGWLEARLQVADCVCIVAFCRRPARFSRDRGSAANGTQHFRQIQQSGTSLALNANDLFHEGARAPLGGSRRAYSQYGTARKRSVLPASLATRNRWSKSSRR